ncbi:unnamed protein product, partial [marine sediment metagenome]
AGWGGRYAPTPWEEKGVETKPRPHPGGARYATHGSNRGCPPGA